MEYPIMTKILVVDNDKFMLEFMNDVLSERGHEVVTAEGGLPAVDILKTYTPDIIFVDLVMPSIDGKQLCKIIRGMPELKDVAIVLLSAIATEENIKIEEFKADACIAKGPVNEMAKHIVKIV
jgi:CheY-like chemotaxis protein